MADISKIKLPNGTEYNIKDSTALHTPLVIMSTNPFTESTEHGASGLYIPKIDNALYCADKRFNVTVSGDYINFDGNHYLFDGDYDNGGTVFRVGNDKTVVITIDFSELPSQKFPGYPYGYIYVSFYYICRPKSITGRVYNNFTQQGIGWKEISFNRCFGSVYRAINNYYGLQTIEITVTGDGSNSYGYTSIVEIDMHLNRPNSSGMPFLSKYNAETLYYDLTAPKFIGSGESLTNLNGSSITSGTVAESRIATLPATKITSGTFDAARIPNLDAGKITSGTLSADRIPSLNASKITDGTLSADRLPTSGVTAGSYGPNGNQSPTQGGTFSVPSITADAKGRVTSASTKTVTLPTYSTATSSANGLMSATDKSKLDSMTTVPIASGLNMTEGTDGLIFTYVS